MSALLQSKQAKATTVSDLGVEFNKDGTFKTHPVKKTYVPAGAVTYNMVRLKYRIQYSPKMTVLLDNINGIQQLVHSAYVFPLVPITRAEFDDLVKNRATLAEITKLYGTVRPDPNQYTMNFQYDYDNEQNIW